MSHRSYTDEELRRAVSGCHSWRGVLRALGLSATSAGSLRSVQRRAEFLGVDCSHFTGQRRWSDSGLAAAVASSRSWAEVATSLGVAPSGGTVDALRAHAVRLAVATDHLARPRPVPDKDRIVGPYRPASLREAGPLLAAAWFTLRGATVVWPLEPCRYDLVVDSGGVLHRVQVKTTTHAGPSAVIVVSSSRRVGRAVYAPGEIDWYFLLDADLTAYLVPYGVVGGFGQIQLGRYAAFRVAERGDLISGASSPAPAPRSRSGFP